MDIRFFIYVGLAVALTFVIVWLVKVALTEVREYRAIFKAATQAKLDFVEYFDETQRLVASIDDGFGRRTITGTAKFTDGGKLVAICTDDGKVIPADVLSEKTRNAIETAEESRRGGKKNG